MHWEGVFVALSETHFGSLCTDRKSMAGSVRILNIEPGSPTRDQALLRVAEGLARAQKDGVRVLKVIHGYGSTGQGGVLRFVVRGFLRQMKEKGEIKLFVNGEDFKTSDERAWELVKKAPEAKADQDFGGKNRGVTLVLL